MTSGWLEDHWGWCGSPITITVETTETFDHPCGFVRLRERHRVKAISVPHNSKETTDGTPQAETRT